MTHARECQESRNTEDGVHKPAEAMKMGYGVQSRNEHWHSSRGLLSIQRASADLDIGCGRIPLVYIYENGDMHTTGMRGDPRELK